MMRLAVGLLTIILLLSACGCAQVKPSRTAVQQQPSQVPTAQPPQAAPQPAPTGPPEYVYVGSDVPTVYHYRADCPAMRGTPLEITYDQARQRRLYPCPTCVPGAR